MRLRTGGACSRGQNCKLEKAALLVMLLKEEARMPCSRTIFLECLRSSSFGSGRQGLPSGGQVCLCPV